MVLGPGRSFGAVLFLFCFSFDSSQRSSLLGRMVGRRRRGTDANNTANGIELSLYGLSPHARAAPELYSFGNKAIRMLSGLCAFAIALRMLCDSVARKILLRVYCIRTTVVELQCYDRAGLEMFFSSEPAGRRREGDPDREVAERPPHDPDRDQRGREAFA